MTTNELIELLKQADPSGVLPVWIDTNDGEYVSPLQGSYGRLVEHEDPSTLKRYGGRIEETPELVMIYV